MRSARRGLGRQHFRPPPGLKGPRPPRRSVGFTGRRRSAERPPRGAARPANRSAGPGGGGQWERGGGGAKRLRWRRRGRGRAEDAGGRRRRQRGGGAGAGAGAAPPLPPAGTARAEAGRGPGRGRLRPHGAGGAQRDAELQELPGHLPQPHGVSLAASCPPRHLPHPRFRGPRPGALGALRPQLPAAHRPRQRGHLRALLQGRRPRCLAPGDQLELRDRPVQQQQPPLGPRPPPVLRQLAAPRRGLLPEERHPPGPGAHQRVLPCRLQGHRGGHLGQCPPGLPGHLGAVQGGRARWGDRGRDGRAGHPVPGEGDHALRVRLRQRAPLQKGFPLGEASPVPQRYFSHELRPRFDPKRCRRHLAWGPQQWPGPQLPPPLAACGDALEVAAFNASSWWQEVDALGQERGWVAERAALGTPGPSWAAEPGAEAAWLELDLGTRRNVTGIVTKGSEMYDCYVTSYSVSSSRDGRNWRPYRGSGGQEDKVFEGNVDSCGEVSNAFIPPIVTRYLRVTPHSWHQRIAMKVALLGCPTVRVRAPRPYAPSDHQEVPLPVPTSRSPGRTPVPGVALDPEKADPTLLVLLLVGGFVLGSSLLLLAFLCRRRRKPAAELNCGIVKGYPKLESSQVCSLGSLPPPGSTPPSFPAAASLGDLSQPHSPEYAEPDLVQVNPSSQPGPSTFKPPPDEGYTLPLVVSHYAVPGQYHEYAEPLPPEPEYATPFGDPEPLSTRRSPCGIAGLPAALSRAGCPESPLARYDAPTLPGEPQGLSGANAAPRGELPPVPHGDSASLERPYSHVYHEAW